MPRNPNKTDYTGGLPEHFDAFDIMEDPRTGGNTRHHFGEILFMSVSAMLCGMNGFVEIEHFCQTQVDWLRKWIKLPNGVPRAQTFSNIFQIIALDGKKLRGSHSLKGGEAIHAVSAWAAENGITLAQEFVAEMHGILIEGDNNNWYESGIG